MTYFLISLPFLILTVVVVVLSLRRPGAKRRLTVSLAAAVVLIILTVIFDNLMIAAGLYDYPEHLISGVRIGRAPVEDLAYPLTIAFGLPALGALLCTRKDAR